MTNGKVKNNQLFWRSSFLSVIGLYRAYEGEYFFRLKIIPFNRSDCSPTIIFIPPRSQAVFVKRWSFGPCGLGREPLRFRVAYLAALECQLRFASANDEAAFVERAAAELRQLNGLDGGIAVPNSRAPRREIGNCDNAPQQCYGFAIYCVLILPYWYTHRIVRQGCT